MTRALLIGKEPAAELGVVTLGGDPAGVSLGGERRQQQTQRTALLIG